MTTKAIPFGRLGIALLAAPAILGLSTCKFFSDPYADYRDTTQNLIASKGLSLATIDTTLAGYQRPAVWTWAWRGASDAGTFDYMTVTSQGTVGGDVSSGGYTLSGSSEAWLLSLENLMPNGDFELGNTASFATDYPGWGTADTLGATVANAFSLVANPPQTHGTQGLSLSYLTNQSAFFRLSGLADYSSSIYAHSYSMLFLLTSTNLAYLTVADPSTFAPGVTETNLIATAQSDEKLTDIINSPSTPASLVFGSAYHDTIATIDDIRVYRDDISVNFKLRLLLRVADTSLKLVPGFYKFSIWVKKTSGSYFLSLDTAQQSATNPYAASAVTLSMNQLDGADIVVGNQAIFNVTSSPYDSSGGWVRLELDMVTTPGSSSNFIDFASNTAPVVELGVMPFDSQHPDTGRIIVAQPELHFYPNGY